ncbi:MAG: hypothetical protein OXJ64_20625 [Boseongicola sp.]|nr:hypothetical protein [Boseongicola sp.]
MDVKKAVGDATSDPDTAVEVAQGLVEVDGVRAIVGPNASSTSLPDCSQSEPAAPVRAERRLLAATPH